MGAELPLLPADPRASLRLAEMAAPAPPPTAGAFGPRRIDIAPEPPDVGPPPPALLITRSPVSLASGGPLPAELSTAFASIDPQYEICNTLAKPDFQGGPVTMELELASSGAPLRVLPVAEGPVSPHTRCLMERACQYQTRASLGQMTRVRIPLQVTREQPLPPPPPPPPPQPQPQVRLDAVSENPSSTQAELQLQLRTLVADAARGCGAVPGRAQVRFLLDLTHEESFRPRPRPRPHAAQARHDAARVLHHLPGPHPSGLRSGVDEHALLRRGEPLQPPPPQRPLLRQAHRAGPRHLEPLNSPGPPPGPRRRSGGLAAP